jgi:transposase-like protein
MLIVSRSEVHCPFCGHYFRENADRLRAGNSVHCPACGDGWTLTKNSSDAEIVSLLHRARQARRTRRERLEALLGGWPA